MTRVATLPLIALLLGGACLFAQQPATAPLDTSAAEAVRREAAARELRLKLTDAETAQVKGDNYLAAKLYSDCILLAKTVGSSVDAEYQQARAGLVVTRLQLADNALRAGNFREATNQLWVVLKEDPKNESALAAWRTVETARLREEGRRPGDATLEKLPEIHQAAVTNATLVQEAKLLYEAGKYRDALEKLKIVVRNDPDNKAAFYYVDLIMNKAYSQEARLRESWSKAMVLDVEKAWNTVPASKLNPLPTPNPYARTNLVHTGQGRQIIYSKMERIMLNTLSFPGVPLNAVVQSLNEEVKKRDPDKEGINFIVSGNVDPIPTPPAAVNPQTGLPEAGAPPETVDIGAIQIRIDPPLTKISLQHALDVIVKVAERPIKFSVEDYGVIFSFRTNEVPPLYTRFFHIDPNTFYNGMQGVTTYEFGVGGGGGYGGFGGGGYGGGGYGGGRGGFGGGRGGGFGGGGFGGGRGGYGGGGFGGGGFGGGGYGGGGGGGAQYIGIDLAAGGGGLSRLGGVAAPGAPGQPGGGGPGGGAGQQGLGGVSFLTEVTPTATLIPIIQTFFRTAGVNLDPPKSVFFNDRLGLLVVRGTLQDLDIVEQAMQALNMSPPQLTIEAKFTEVSQDDTRALGFDWFLGNTLMKGGAIGMQGGTAPSFIGTPSAANPSGVFPGPGPAERVPGIAAVQPSATDNQLTSGLRQNASPLMTFTGILTDPQFRVVIRALEQRQGVDLLSAPKITTLSGRQAQIKIVDVRYIVIGLDTTQSGGGSFGGGFRP